MRTAASAVPFVLRSSPSEEGAPLPVSASFDLEENFIAVEFDQPLKAFAASGGAGFLLHDSGFSPTVASVDVSEGATTAFLQFVGEVVLPGTIQYTAAVAAIRSQATLTAAGPFSGLPVSS